MDSPPPFEPVSALCKELSLPAAGIAAVVALLGDGNTVPFIARYRKEVTGSLDEVQIRSIEERHAYLDELDQRRRTILQTIDQQGKLTDELQTRILAAETKASLEDLYLPYRPKRRTRATIAKERGLEPLAQRILSQPDEGDPLTEAQAFVDPEAEVPDAEAALAGARDIVAELVAERAEVRALARETFFASGQMVCEVVPDKKHTPTKFEQYYDYREPVGKIPSHRFLAIRRGEREEVLRARIEVEADPLLMSSLALMDHRPDTPFAEALSMAVVDAFVRLVAPGVETDVRVELKVRSDRDAVQVFAENLRNLLMAAPLGDRSVIGFDPGLRTGCKVAAMDATGRFLVNTTLYLSRSESEREKARAEVLALIQKHAPEALAVGNGTGGRETEGFLRKVIAESDLGGRAPVVVQVSEAGASVYSASDLARKEFPDQDLTVRGAISIGRRLQDPLAELVKLDPKVIGVGQYQHDVHQPMLARKLDEVVESCVNQVGVELNTASAPLLSRVAGIGPKLADGIVAHREAKGVFDSRKHLLKVAGLGPKTFEQAAGFLRVRGGEQPLDASAVHPERYELVARMAKDMGVGLADLVGDAAAAGRIDLSRYVSDEVGEPTLRDIVAELGKPGRDPRDKFDPVQFRDDVKTISDLQPGMSLQGVVSNVTNFGAFVDVGVHRDGLVHISQLADKFVEDPHQVVKVGDKLQVRVLEVDTKRDRISLTARSDEAPPKAKAKGSAEKDRGAKRPRPAQDGKKRPPRRGRDDRPRQSKSALPKEDTSVLTHNPFADLFKKK
jgi:uncharacterized protein